MSAQRPLRAGTPAAAVRGELVVMDNPELKVKGPAAERETAGGIKSAKRVLELFDYFAECRRPLTVNDVVQGLDYPQSSASVLLKGLTRLGYLDYDRYRRVYTPTLRVALSSGWLQDQGYGRTSLSSVMDQLHRRSGGMTAILGMQNDIHVQYIHVVQAARRGDPRYLKPGSLRPLCRSAIGRILLSLRSNVQAQQLLWRINAEERPTLRLDAHDLARDLDAIRTQGYAFSEGWVTPDTSVIAVALPTPPGHSPMALGLGGTVESLHANRGLLLELLQEVLEPCRASLLRDCK